MNNRQKNIWIFGGTGFIGDALVSQLALNQENRLFLLLHRTTNFKKYEDFDTFLGNLSKFDYRLFERYPPEIIFHLARFAGGNVLTRYFASQRAYKSNLRLIKMLQNLEKPPVVIYVSGSLMYGPQPGNTAATEQSPMNPVAFAEYYIKGEKPWIEAQKKEILDIRFARPGWIVGPSSWFSVFFWNFYLETGKIPYYGDGSQFMSVIGLKDCARLIGRLGREGEVGQNLNIITLPPVTQKEFSTILARRLNVPATSIPLSGLIRKYGKTVAAALTSSIPLSTEYSAWYQNFKPASPDLESVFDEVLYLLKNK